MKFLFLCTFSGLLSFEACSLNGLVSLPDLFSSCRNSYEVCKEAADWLRARAARRPRIAIVCGSGLRGLADMLDSRTVFLYEDIPHFPQSSGEHSSGHQHPTHQQPAAEPHTGITQVCKPVPHW